MFTRSIITATATLLVTSPTAFAHDQVVTKEEVGKEVGLCVDRIGNRADYENAHRVVHRVVDISQKNIAEQQLRIDTLVFAADDTAAIRQYASTCVTHGPLKVVSFRIEETADPALTAGL